MRGAALIPPVIAIATVAILGAAILRDPSTPTERRVTSTVPLPPCVYHSSGALPDPTCTPGALNPNVTQATIQQTICMTGWTASVRPALTITTAEKTAGIQAYGAKYGKNLNAYEFDHLVPLEIGGALNDPKNLWPEPAATVGGNGSYDKDAIENHLNAEVCNGKMTLVVAQAIFEHDWRNGRSQ